MIDDNLPLADVSIVTELGDVSALVDVVLPEAWLRQYKDCDMSWFNCWVSDSFFGLNLSCHFLNICYDWVGSLPTLFKNVMDTFSSSQAICCFTTPVTSFIRIRFLFPPVLFVVFIFWFFDCRYPFLWTEAVCKRFSFSSTGNPLCITETCYCLHIDYFCTNLISTQSKHFATRSLQTFHSLSIRRCWI